MQTATPPVLSMLRFSSSKPEYAVIGLGRFGSSLALALKEHGHNVLGIDRRQDVVQALADRLTKVVVLDSSDERALRAVDIGSFSTVVVAIGTNFEANLLTTAVLKDLGVQHVICKALNERQRTILERIGASKVILPEHEAGQRLARDLCTPWLSEQIALGPEHSLVQIHVPRGLVGQTLHEADLRRRFGVIIITATREGVLSILPTGEFTFAKDDIISVIGGNQALGRMLEALR